MGGRGAGSGRWRAATVYHTGRRRRRHPQRRAGARTGPARRRHRARSRSICIGRARAVDDRGRSSAGEPCRPATAAAATRPAGQRPRVRGQGGAPHGRRGDGVHAHLPRCHGVGSVFSKPCATRRQRARGSRRLNVHIRPASTPLAGVVAGKAGLVKGVRRRATLLAVKVRPHPLLERRGDDLYMDLPGR